MYKLTLTNIEREGIIRSRMNIKAAALHVHVVSIQCMYTHINIIVRVG